MDTIVWIARPIGMTDRLVNNSESAQITVNKINSLRNLWKERTSKSARNVSFGWRELRGAIIWLVDVGLNFVISVGGLIKGANVEDLISANLMMINNDEF